MLQENISLEELSVLIAEVRSDRLLPLREAAEYLNEDPSQVRRWAREGVLPAEKVGDRFVFRLPDLVQWEINGRLRLRTPACVPELFA